MPQKKGRRMPRRKRGIRRKRHFYGSVVKGKKDVMVNRAPAKLHNLVAPHFLTKMMVSFTGAQSLVAGSQGDFSVWLNGLNFPCATTGGLPAHSFINAANGGTVYPAALAIGALQPTGFSQIGVLYGRYRVLAAKLVITCTPTGGADCILVVGCDTNDSTTVGSDTQKAAAQPYHKMIQCSSTNNLKQNTISLYMDAPTIAGLTRQQYYDSDNVTGATPAAAGGAANPGTKGASFFNIFTSAFRAGDAISNNIDVRVTYWVDFYEPLPPTDV